ncbi:MAG: hypothetical protein C5B50_00290 [Verrucomicrobia bacterium]|nr:MAG: hypothetical protein C5B50_00290 [Verrucomicrobiota bacterium]
MGECFDLLDTAYTRPLRTWYMELRDGLRKGRVPLPANRDAPGARRGDKVLRFRDRAVIDYALRRIAEKERITYQTVRGVFIEGAPAFPGSRIALKSHIQIAVRDPRCILDFFSPAARIRAY